MQSLLIDELHIFVDFCNIEKKEKEKKSCFMFEHDIDGVSSKRGNRKPRERKKRENVNGLAVCLEIGT